MDADRLMPRAGSASSVIRLTWRNVRRIDNQIICQAIFYAVCLAIVGARYGNAGAPGTVAGVVHSLVQALINAVRFATPADT